MAFGKDPNKLNNVPGFGQASLGQQTAALSHRGGGGGEGEDEGKSGVGLTGRTSS